MKSLILSALAVVLLVSIFINNNLAFALPIMMVDASDIVGGASDDIAGGSSVFVFKVPKKQPHKRNAQRKAAFKRTAIAKNESRRKRIDLSEALAAKRPKPAPKSLKPRVPAPEKQAEILALAGQKLFDQKNFDAAETKFKQARQLNPKNEAAKNGLIATYIKRGDRAFDAKDFKSAAAIYELALGLDSNNADAYASLGEAYDALDQPEKAAPAYENAYQRSSEFKLLGPTVAMMYFDANNYSKAETYLREALQTNQNDPELNNALGLALFKQDKNAEAIAAFQKSVQALPSFAPAHYNLGEAYDKTNRETEAVAAYKEAVRQDPNLAEPHYGLGVVAYNRENYTESVAHYQKAIELKPDFIEAKNNLADAYRQLEKFPEAVAVYKTIVVETPDDPILYSKYGYCEGKANNWNESAQLLEKSAALDGTADDYSNVSWAYNNAGRAAEKNKNQEQAEQNFTKAKINAEKAQEKDANSAAAKFNLGDALTALGQAALAISAFRAALQIKPSWAEAHNNLGLALIVAGDLAGASGEFRNATSVNNNFVGAFANLAIVESKRGNKKEAGKAKSRVKELNPTLAAKLDSYIAQYVLNKVEQKVQKETNEAVRKAKRKISLPF